MHLDDDFEFLFFVQKIIFINIYFASYLSFFPEIENGKIVWYLESTNEIAYSIYIFTSSEVQHVLTACHDWQSHPSATSILSAKYASQFSFPSAIVRVSAACH